MAVHIENLHVGDWVTGCNDLRPEEDYGFFGCRQPLNFDGMPWKVKAISAPFIVAERDGCTVTMDLRVVGLTKLSAAYVRVLRNTKIDTSDDKPIRRAKKRVKTKRDPRDCPRCGQRMVQRIPNGSPKRLWHRVCPDCGYDQGPVENATP